jgi:sulfite reductase beta subunit-like hemoprotein
MCTANPLLSKLHAEVYALAKQASDHATHKTGAYGEIWYGAERQDGDGPEEPFYGRTYMPRKFKIGFAIPPSNDIDVYSQDLGFIAIAGRGRLEGFNVAVGGGLGRTDQNPKTYRRLADVIGYRLAASCSRTSAPPSASRYAWPRTMAWPGSVSKSRWTLPSTTGPPCRRERICCAPISTTGASGCGRPTSS